MASADKITIFTGDTLKIKYESLQADPMGTNEYGFTKSEALPDSAFAQVWNVTAQQFLEIGGVGTDQDAADVSGNLITYLLLGTFTQEAGSYKIFITAVYPDGQEVTEVRAFKVANRS